MSAYQQLYEVFENYYFLRRARSVLDWDTAVMMPAGSALIRSKQLAALQGVMQDLIGDKKIARLIKKAEDDAETLSPWQQANLREISHLYRLNAALPDNLKQALISQTVMTECAWRVASDTNDFKPFRNAFSQLLPLIRNKAQHLSQVLGVSPYEGLMQEYDWGRTEVETDHFFDRLEAGLPGLLARISKRQDVRTPACKPPALSINRQKPLCKHILRDMGFDFNIGRLDRSLHPFTEGGYQDIRITTYYDKNDVCKALMGTMHEFGHAQYDANLPQDWYTQPAGHDRGMSLHEGMALFYEMTLGRTRAFIDYLGKIYQDLHWEFDEIAFQCALLHSRPGCIRVEADEISYIPHIILRYRMEQSLLDDSLSIDDIPECWDDHMQRLFNLQPQTLREGCLQDIHWSLGLLGYFPSYAFGAVNAANLCSNLQQEGIVPKQNGYDRDFFLSVQHWLKENISRHGSFFSEQELMDRLKLGNVDRYFKYLESKYPQ